MATAAPAAAPTADPRLTAFCAPGGSDVFHSIVYQPQVWTPDPFDVESVHAEPNHQHAGRNNFSEHQHGCLSGSHASCHRFSHDRHE